MIDIGPRMPSNSCINANAHALARYAALCQDEGIVPIVEPEVLMDGEHDADRCYNITEWVLKTVFMELYHARVKLEGMVLKPNMVIAGKKAKNRAGVEEVAEKTVRVLKDCVPAAVPGIAFLSGGQSDEEATAHLDAMNRIAAPAAALAAHLLLWPRAAGGAAEDLGRQGRERRRRAARLRAPRRDERPRRDRAVEAGPGAQGGVAELPDAVACEFLGNRVPDRFCRGDVGIAARAVASPQSCEAAPVKCFRIVDAEPQHGVVVGDRIRVSC